MPFITRFVNRILDGVPLERNLILLLATVGTLALATIALLINLHARSNLHEQSLQRARHLVGIIQNNLPLLSPADLQKLVESMGQAEGVEIIVVAGGEPAQILMASRPEWLGLPLTQVPHEHLRAELQEAVSSRLLHRHEEEGALGFSIWAQLPFIVAGGNESDWGVISLYLDDSEVRLRAWHAGLRTTAWMLPALALAFLLVYLALRTTLVMPIRRLSQALLSQSKQTPLYPLRETGGYEIRLLARYFNALFERLAASQS